MEKSTDELCNRLGFDINQFSELLRFTAFYLTLQHEGKEALKMRDREHEGNWNSYLASLPGTYDADKLLAAKLYDILIPPMMIIRRVIEYERVNNINLGEFGRKLEEILK